MSWYSLVCGSRMRNWTTSSLIFTPLAAPSCREPSRPRHRRRVRLPARSPARPRAGYAGGPHDVHHIRHGRGVDEVAGRTELGASPHRRPGQVASAGWSLGLRRSRGGQVGPTPGPRTTARAAPALPRPHNDTWIAACCLVDGIPLATLNTKDFADFA